MGTILGEVDDPLAPGKERQTCLFLGILIFSRPFPFEFQALRGQEQHRPGAGEVPREGLQEADQGAQLFNR